MSLYHEGVDCVEAILFEAACVVQGQVSLSLVFDILAPDPRHRRASQQSREPPRSTAVHQADVEPSNPMIPRAYSVPN